ncbi:MAG: hypothetical protein KU37_08715 [Sulfuricurvum sp. PC08-66]|nr:MAG: hypothetical protein KU37_08715 [Sulfuricurvum sp. PC08-66]
MKVALYSSIALAALLTVGCQVQQNGALPNAYTIATSGYELPYSVMRADLKDERNVSFEIRNGGYGSAASAHPTNVNQFYAITDRGPNAAYTVVTKGMRFPVSYYTPRIGLFEVNSDGTIDKVKDILLRDRNGSAISGLPNKTYGGTSETPCDAQGNLLLDENNATLLDEYGLDSEGLVAMDDGTFWVSDEYGPHIVHYSATGVEIDRINAFADDNRTSRNLPAEFSKRWTNRGMEGLTVTPDQKTLVGIMQSTLDNPSNVRSDLTRIVAINLETNVTRQYLYKQDIEQNSNSEIVALSATKFLVIERDGKFYRDDQNAQKYIYKIDLSTGTELESMTLGSGMEQNATNGLTIDGQTLEQVVHVDGNWSRLTTKGINPVEKTLVVDMVKEVKYPHDKMEGIWLIDDTTIGIINDNDFALWTTSNKLHQKFLDEANTTIDGNTMYIIKNLNLN